MDAGLCKYVKTIKTRLNASFFIVIQISSIKES